MECGVEPSDSIKRDLFPNNVLRNSLLRNGGMQNSENLTESSFAMGMGLVEGVVVVGGGLVVLEVLFVVVFHEFLPFWYVVGHFAL